MIDRKTKILACAVVIEELRSKLPSEVVCEILDFGLHRTPNALKTALQEKIDQTTDCETIVLAFGLCGQATLGLQSRSSTLVIPRADDCIAIFLGSRANYLREQKEFPGSLFLSKGWIEGRIDDSVAPPRMPHFDVMVERYGEERAMRMQSVYQEKYRLRNYKRMAFITTTGESNLEDYKETARKRAARLSLQYQEIQGSTAFMEKIAGGDWDDEFIVVPPGRPISFYDFWPDADKASMPQTDLS